jgi:predicted metalloprotease with PDZ domain
LRTPEEYVKSLNGTFNYVWNSNGTKYFNPIEMSYQAPFVDAATSLDPQNRNNTFISYYSYGSVLGLALDLSLREKDLNLDDFFKRVWGKFGKKEIPYTIKDLHLTLNEYAGKTFGDNFFNNHVYKSKMPDYQSLFSLVGLNLAQESEAGYLGASVNKNTISNNTLVDSPAYKAGLEKGDVILIANDTPMEGSSNFSDFLKSTTKGDKIKLSYRRIGKVRETVVTLAKDPAYSITINPNASTKASTRRDSWLK